MTARLKSEHLRIRSSDNRLRPWPQEPSPPPVLASGGPRSSTWDGSGRALASIILVLVVVREGSIPDTPLIIDLMAATVGLSVILHGLTAWWGSNLYGDWARDNHDTPTP